jgi:hypothetical protein
LTVAAVFPENFLVRRPYSDLGGTCRFRLAAFAIALGALSSARAESPKCDNDTLTGPYGFTLTGWRIPAPDTNLRSARAGVGRIVFDGKGNLSGTETKSHDGLITPLTFTGTYQVLTDCTGTAHVVTSDPDENARNLSFTIIESGEQVMAIQTDQGRAVTVIVTKQRGRQYLDNFM